MHNSAYKDELSCLSRIAEMLGHRVIVEGPDHFWYMNWRNNHQCLPDEGAMGWLRYYVVQEIGRLIASSVEAQNLVESRRAFRDAHE